MATPGESRRESSALQGTEPPPAWAVHPLAHSTSLPDALARALDVVRRERRQALLDVIAR